MDVYKELDAFQKRINEAKDNLSNREQERLDWCRKNKSEVKKLFPKKGEIYQVINIDEALKYSWYSDNLNEKVYYFRATNIRFSPSNDFDNYSSNQVPTVKGDILDCNLNKAIEDTRVYINHLIDVKDEDSPDKLQKEFTKVYVMIDKNTGFYKIGRSKRPRTRERTLQSEKPTIEMLFTHDARVKDEKELHEMFNEKRVRGEWFDLSGSDLNKIREYFGVV